MTQPAPASIAARNKVIAHALLALLLVGALVWWVVTGHASGWPAVALFLMPDVALLYGIAPGLAKGQLHPRAVRPYNWLHSFVGPAALGAVAVAGTLSGVLGDAGSWIAAALAWAAHVAVDRSVGYGPRTPGGFQRGARSTSPPRATD
jgi:hypothetical protein